MQNLLIFISHQWLAVVIFVILLLALLWIETQGKVGGCKRLNPQQVVHMLNRESAVIFDLRDKNAFSQGHIAGALHIPESTLASKNLGKYKDKPIILISAGSTHPPKLSNKLKPHGLHKLYFLHGGMGAWTNANLPTVK